jgi:transcriptional regulator with XRE-family HTH domain
VTARRQRIGLKIKELAEHAGVSPDTLSDWERGLRNPQTETVDAVLSTLDRMEEEMGFDAPPAVTAIEGEGRPKLVRFKVEGVYGVDALTVEGPPENLPELLEAVDRIMRGNAQRRDTEES